MCVIYYSMKIPHICMASNNLITLMYILEEHLYTLNKEVEKREVKHNYMMREGIILNLFHCI